ncbi:TadG family pilus assembly protein [Solimonas sp. K1W22B-7]|uniref:TadG family pilus assembly protein n=1 Tax=Solimonas sp. K1W22B-7 TaxID=2303331 RepID=UPI0013C51D3E|nr:TadG family pilus assembly protein [Solimonas sp. K1W22B-7]
MIYRRARLNSPHQQRGAVAVFAAVLLVALLTSAVLVIEIGRVYLAQRGLQKMATFAAMDAARVVSGCGDAPTQTRLDAAVTASLAKNGYPEVLTSQDIEVGVVEVNADSLRELDPTDLEDARAVRVTLKRKFPSLLTPLLGGNSGIMVASATATEEALGSFSLGSGVASLNQGMLNALLSGLLGGNVNLTLINYQGLASTNVSLEALALAVGVDATDLSDPLALSTKTPVLSDVLNGLAGSLSGTASGTVTGLLTGLAASASGNRNQIPLGQVLGAIDDVAAGVPFISLLDLILALGEAATPTVGGGPKPIALPVNINIPNVASAAVFVKILEPAQLSGLKRAGQARASTAQIRLLVRTQVALLNTLKPVLNGLVCLGGLACNIDIPPINIGIDVDVAKADAVLTRIDCPRTDVNGGMPIAELSAEPAVAVVSVGTFTGAVAAATPLATVPTLLTRIHVSLLNLPGLQLADINIDLKLDSPVDAKVGTGYMEPLPNEVTQFTRCVAQGDPSARCAASSDLRPYWLADVPVANENPQTVGSRGLLQGTLSSLLGDLVDEISIGDPAHPGRPTICLLKILGICTIPLNLGPVLDTVLNLVSGVLAPVLSALGAVLDAVLDPLLQSLGIRLGSATVTMNVVTVAQPSVVSKDVPADTTP